jgi:uncharacterized membrane protein YozB (DUF420 family)
MTVLSFLFRADNIEPVLAVGICWLIVGVAEKKYRVMEKQMGAMLAGAVLALLLIALFLWGKGILAKAWNAAIIYNFFYIKNRTDIWSSIGTGFRDFGW